MYVKIILNIISIKMELSPSLFFFFGGGGGGSSENKVPVVVGVE